MERGSVKNISGYLTRRMQGGTVLRNQRDNISLLNYLKISKRSYKGGRRRYRTIPLLQENINSNQQDRCNLRVYSE